MDMQATVPTRHPERFTLALEGRNNQYGSIHLRRAIAADQPAIIALVRSERLKPHDLDWRRFWVAAHGSQIVGAGQVRRHPDGSREVSSVVIAPPYRGQGLAARLLQMLLATSSGEHYLITAVALSRHYATLGFERIRIVRAPYCIRRNYWLGQLIGAVIACCKWSRPRRLIIMYRPSFGS